MNRGSVTYVDDKGFHLYVSDGISKGAYFFTVRKAPYGHKGERRVCSPALLHRKTIAEAETDLVAYADRKSWRPLDKAGTGNNRLLFGKGEARKQPPPAYVHRSQLGLL
jgi:hypothetical protein